MKRFAEIAECISNTCHTTNAPQEPEMTEADLTESMAELMTLVTNAGYDLDLEEGAEYTYDDYLEAVGDLLADPETQMDEGLKKMVFGVWQKIKGAAQGAAEKAKGLFKKKDDKDLGAPKRPHPPVRSKKKMLSASEKAKKKMWMMNRRKGR
jgi:hypothetical protein